MVTVSVLGCFQGCSSDRCSSKVTIRSLFSWFFFCVFKTCGRRINSFIVRFFAWSLLAVYKRATPLAWSSFLILFLNVTDMAKLVECSLTIDEYAVVGLLREARGLGYRRIEMDVYNRLIEEFDGEPEVIELDRVPEVALYEVIDLTSDEDVPNVAELIGK